MAVELWRQDTISEQPSWLQSTQQTRYLRFITSKTVRYICLLVLVQNLHSGDDAGAIEVKTEKKNAITKQILNYIEVTRLT